ncbi:MULTISPECIES: hypothetical protein [Chryseobacterium]|uniref:DUF4258 domain-containing protein n=1 Tax=Chryseobacterium endophyticum TaxID=1854762 RepID=A0AAU6WU77_9FLAO|nr:hypothetical protein [uncultured Chryseobacterium sp.]
MITLTNLINLFTRRVCHYNLWNIRIGYSKYYIHEVLNNYELLGKDKAEVTAYLAEYPLYKEHNSKYWCYEIKSASNYKYLLIFLFDGEKIKDVRYSHVKV